MKRIGFVVCFVLLFISSTTLASNQNEIASKLMKTQNCSFNINRHNLSYDNVETLRGQQLETIQNVQEITKYCATKLIQDSPNFETLISTLRSGIRFGGGFYTPDEDIQLGTGPLNYRKSIHSTGDVLKRFGHELNKMAEKFWIVQLTLNFQPEWSEVVYSVDLLVGMFRKELPTAFTVMYGFIGPNFQRKSFRDSIEQLKRLADCLVELANQFEGQLVRQKENCERYLKDTFKDNAPMVKISDTRSKDSLALEDFGEKSLSIWRKMSNSTHSNEFLNQITAFAKLPKSTEKADQYAIMLKYMSTATLDMLNNLKSSSDSAESSNLIYDKDSFWVYVKKVKSTLNELLERHMSEHEKQLANIVVKISHNPTHHFNPTSDVPQLSLVSKVLERQIHSKFVLQKYDAVVEALKQHVFPYVHLYLADVDDFNRNSTDIEYLVKKAVESLDTMTWTITDNGANTFRQVFDSVDMCTQAPFYVWSGNAVEKLLSGQSVTLKADIRNSDPEWDAIKFRTVNFNFKAKNPALQPEIDARLNWFRISATHMGDSYYRFQGKYYMMKHEPLKIVYSFTKNSDGVTPFKRNFGPFFRFQEGSTLITSPYANWQIQLTPMNRLASFEKLAKFKDKVYLEMVGEGKFIDSEAVLNDDMHLEKYYTEYYSDEDISAQGIEQRQQSLQLMKRECN